MEQMARYKQLTCPEEILQEKDDEEWSIQFRWLLADEVEPPVLIECCFAWVLSIARHGTGTRLSPLRVEFVQPRSHVKTIERHFGCPVVCGAPRNAIVFRAADAQRPFVTRNAELLAMLAPQFEEELKQENGEENFVERVRVAIQQKLTGRRPDHRGYRRRATYQLAYPAAAIARRRLQLPARFGRSSSPACAPLSQ